MSVTINASTSSGLVQTADTSGTVEIQSNGSTKLTVSSTGAYGQLVSATAQASTSGTSIDFTGIPSWVKRITVMFNGVSTSGTSVVQVQLGDSGGFETTSYLGSANTFNATPSASNYSSGFVFIEDVAAATIFHGNMTITNISGNTWTESHSGGVSSSAAVTFGGGSKSLSDTLTQIRITTVNGTDTFDAGTINILYEG